MEKDADRPALTPDQVRAVKRIVNRHPLVILKARNTPGFVAADVGPDESSERKIERVTVSFDGTTTTLGIVDCGEFAIEHVGLMMCIENGRRS